MIGIEKDILILISRVRCMTETQFNKVFTTRKKGVKKPFKKTLRKMCNEYTLKKYPCNINYPGYKDNTYIYYLNGSKMYKGDDLLKVIIGSEIVIRINLSGYELKRIYRNISVGDSKYNLFLEYTDKYNELKQVLVDVDLNDSVDLSKYEKIKNEMEKCTIPFYDVPKILVVTSGNVDKMSSRKNKDCDVDFLDLTLNKLFRYI